jgi:hypothetical protein
MVFICEQMSNWRSVDGHVLRVENCPMFVKHHVFLEMLIPSLDGSYRQMAKQSHENYRMKVLSHFNFINTMNYFHRAK